MACCLLLVPGGLIKPGLKPAPRNGCCMLALKCYSLKVKLAAEGHLEMGGEAYK